jgi:hypothetical protein
LTREKEDQNEKMFGGAAVKQEKVQLFFSATHLPNMEMMSKTDAFAAVFVRDGYGGEHRHACVTEVVHNCNAPRWVKNHFMDSNHGHEIIIRVYQHGHGALDHFSNHTLIGECKFHLHELIRAQACHLTLGLSRHHHPTGNGHIHVRAEVCADSQEQFVAMINAHGLHPHGGGFFRKADPFFEISRVNEDGSKTLVHRSEVIKETLNPHWKEMCISMITLCNGDHHRPLHIEIYDHEGDGNHHSLGHIHTSAHALVHANASNIHIKKDNRDVGHINAKNCRIQNDPLAVAPIAAVAAAAGASSMASHGLGAVAAVAVMAAAAPAAAPAPVVVEVSPSPVAAVKAAIIEEKIMEAKVRLHSNRFPLSLY